MDGRSTVLDVGAGAGRHSVPLARVVRRVFAVEPSAAMASHLREWAQEEGLGNIEVIEGAWPDVNAPTCDVAICSHVLYPVAEIEPFLRKLHDSARRRCFLWLHAEQTALESLGLWERFYGEPRARQPTFRDALPVLWQMGLRPNLEMSEIPESWSWGSMDEAAQAFREHLAIPEDEATEARLRQELAAALVEREGRLYLPKTTYRSAIVWWGKEDASGCRGPMRPRRTCAEGSPTASAASVPLPLDFRPVARKASRRLAAVAPDPPRHPSASSRLAAKLTDRAQVDTDYTAGNERTRALANLCLSVCICGQSVDSMSSLPPHIAALLSPEAYPHKVERVDLVQTHISYVFLAGDFVYKVKKPVDLGFLDFTTLEKRRHFCQEEVRLNRRLCPGIYLDVVPVAYVEGNVAVDAAGTVVDYAVKMKRLPEERMMGHLLEKDAVTPEMVRGLARRLAEFHASAETGPDIEAFGGLETIAGNWRENFDQTEPYVGRTITARQFQEIRDTWRAS